MCGILYFWKKNPVTFTPQYPVPTTPVRIQPKRLEDLMDKDNGTKSVIIEPTEAENLIVELDPAQLLLGMFDDAPDPIPSEVRIKYAICCREVDVEKRTFSFGKKQVFANHHSVNMKSDGSKRFKGSDTLSQDDFVQMIKQYPCLYGKSFSGKADLETLLLKRNAWQEMAKLTGRAGTFSQLLFIHFA